MRWCRGCRRRAGLLPPPRRGGLLPPPRRGGLLPPPRRGGLLLMSGKPGLLHRVDALVWGAREAPLARGQSPLLHGSRMLLILGRDLALGPLTLRAMGLV